MAIHANSIKFWVCYVIQTVVCHWLMKTNIQKEHFYQLENKQIYKKLASLILFFIYLLFIASMRV